MSDTDKSRTNKVRRITKPEIVQKTVQNEKTTLKLV